MVVLPLAEEVRSISDHISVTQLPCCLQQAGTQQAGGEKVGKNTTFLMFDVCSTTPPLYIHVGMHNTEGDPC